MRLSQARDALRIFLEDPTLVPFLWGGSAIGKTALVESLGRETNRLVIPLHLYTQDHGDLLGAMRIEGEVTTWARPEWWPSGDQDTILFLDELNMVQDETIKAAANQLVHERRLHVHRLPPNVFVIGAGNPEGTGYAVDSMLRPQVSRLCHLMLTPDPVDWLDWAEEEACADRVVDFIRSNPHRLYEPRDEHVDLELCGRPRCWHNVSKFLIAGGEQLEPELLHEVLSGMVGTRAATEFMDESRTKDRGLDEWIRLGRHDRAMEILHGMRDRLLTEPASDRLDNLLNALRKTPREMRVPILKTVMADYRVAELARHRLVEIRALQEG